MNLLAQLAIENPALYTYGPLGIFCAFFMWRDVAREKAYERERSLFLEEMKKVRHSMDGLQRAILVTAVEHSIFPPAVQDYARRQIAKIDAAFMSESARDAAKP